MVEPKYLAIDANHLSGTVKLNGVKTVQVEFRNTGGDPVSFTKAPRVQLTPKDNTTDVPYKYKDVKTGNFYTGFVIGFSSPVTMEVEWQVSERF